MNGGVFMSDIEILPPIGVSGFEVYKTENDPEFSLGENSKDKFVALNGTTTEIACYDNMYDNSFDEDYEGISNTGSASFPEIELDRFCKGRKICLKKANDTGEVLQWDDLVTCLLGFISEQTFTTEGVDLKLVGMSKLLDQEKQFTFTKTKRSEILKQIIEAAGLKADVDPTGLNDEVIDYTNVSSSGSSATGGEGETIDELVKSIIGSETDDLKKCKLIHDWLKKNVKYSYYSCSKYSSAEECLNNKTRLNCADTARLTRSMMASAGLKCYVVQRTYDGGHFWTIIEINGKKYASDQTGDGSAFNTVWKASGRTSVSDGGAYSKKCGDNPCC